MSPPEAAAAVEAAYRSHSRRVLATLVRLLGSFDAAEDALHDAFAVAAEQWPREGIPENPYAWLVSTGRFKTIDRWRAQARQQDASTELARLVDTPLELALPEPIQDDELRLIFICCHPALAPDAQIALTLREVGGLTTEEIARAYLVPTPTIAQRIVRAKTKIRGDAIAYEVPPPTQLPARLASVLQVLYLIFNEGYVATGGPHLTRPDLCTEALRLMRLVLELLDDPEALGLYALMQLHEARRAARVDSDGNLILLEDQNRALWDRQQIAAAGELIECALRSRRVGPYALQAAIAALHAQAASVDATDWPQIVALYDVLQRVDPSAVIALNRAVAIGMRDGAAAGLTHIEAVLSDHDLDNYHLAHAARADMLRRLGHIDAARLSYRRALELTRQPAERRFLQHRLEQLADL